VARALDGAADGRLLRAHRRRRGGVSRSEVRCRLPGLGRADPAFFPDLSGWTQAALPFSWRNALRREYNGFYAIVASLTAIEIATDLIGESISFDEWSTKHPEWLVFLAVGTMIWLVVRTIKKRTDWLRVEGR
jgi:hypothetical protein